MSRPLKPLAGPDDPRHGTVTAYTRHGCRCDPCRTAATAARRRYPNASRDRYRLDARRYRAIVAAVTPSTALTLAYDKDADGNPVVRLSIGLRRIVADSVDEAVEALQRGNE